MSKNIIKAVKGIVYFPSRSLAVDFAVHCGLKDFKVASCLKGWFVQPAANAAER